VPGVGVVMMQVVVLLRSHLTGAKKGQRGYISNYFEGKGGFV
jgi:hypothetical protein